MEELSSLRIYHADFSTITEASYSTSLTMFLQERVRIKASAIIPPSHSGVFSFPLLHSGGRAERELGSKRLQSSPKSQRCFQPHTSALRIAGVVQPLLKLLKRFLLNSIQLACVSPRGEFRSEPS
ncbi:hypothetical protein CEXT_212821 [Caerostris extrusa]|uniref:Uncharacterized protein n=1 Tax=Caerostris extrusa TaxID=172846 RepID=A0AAV4R3S6_CAEEX|nr:hypothetical protein CEXT_212821 [Caerostris extrusa]